MMDEKMKAAFDAWAKAEQSDCGHYPDAYAGVVWTLDYLRSQQEPVAWLQVGVDRPDVIARTTKPTQWNPEWWRFDPLYAHPIPLPADPPNEALMEAFDRYQADKVANQGSSSVLRVSAPDTNYLDIVFDGPPSHVTGRFVEVENDKGASVGVGEWLKRTDGYWVLRLPYAPNKESDHD